MAIKNLLAPYFIAEGILLFEGGKGIVRTFGYKLDANLVLINCLMQMISASSAVTHMATSRIVQHPRE
jgi:hypothetical protein